MPPGCSSTLPARFGTWFQLVFGAHHVPLPYSALWGQCHHPPRLGAVSTWTRMDTWWGYSTGEGWALGDEGVVWEKPRSCLKCAGVVNRSSPVVARLQHCRAPWSSARQVWTSEVPQLLPPHLHTTGFASWAPKLVFLGRCLEIKLLFREECIAHFCSFIPKPLLPADALRRGRQ